MRGLPLCRTIDRNGVTELEHMTTCPICTSLMVDYMLSLGRSPASINVLFRRMVIRVDGGGA